MELHREDRTGRVIGAAIEVHRTLGPGFLESVYENALGVELRRRAIPYIRQGAVPIVYQGIEVGTHILDLLVEDQLVVELKSVKRLDDIHFVVPRSYLKAVGRELGLLLDFSGTTLAIKRVVKQDDTPCCSVPGFRGSRAQTPDP